MARKSKFFRVAVEGATTDGRKIERNWLIEIAKNYNREKYGARLFIEHIRGYNPEMGFRCQGDVLAVKTDTIEIDGQKKLGLFAQLEPTAEFIGLTKKGQKIYSSIEVNPDFAGSGEAYLVGLGVTDSPASLGTEVLEFAAQHPEANPFSARKQHPDNVFSAAEPCDIEFEEEQTNDPGAGLLAKVKAMFSSKDRSDDVRFSDVQGAVEHVAQAAADAAAAVATLTRDFTDLRACVDGAKSAHDQAIADLTAKLDHAAAPDPVRPRATGGSDVELTDC